MISKEKFVEIMEELETLDKKYDEINEVGKALDFFTIHPTEYQRLVIKVLESIFNDNSNWVSYFICDLEYGEDWYEGCITDNGIDVPLRNAGELYDLLTAGGDDDGKTEE